MVESSPECCNQSLIASAESAYCFDGAPRNRYPVISIHVTGRDLKSWRRWMENAADHGVHSVGGRQCRVDLSMPGWAAG